MSIEDTSKNQIFTYEIGPKKRLLQEIELTFGDKKDAIASADLISIVFGNQKKCHLYLMLILSIIYLI